MYDAYMPFRRNLDNNTQNILTRQRKKLLGIQVVVRKNRKKVLPPKMAEKHTSGFENCPVFASELLSVSHHGKS